MPELTKPVIGTIVVYFESWLWLNGTIVDYFESWPWSPVYIYDPMFIQS